MGTAASNINHSPYYSSQQPVYRTTTTTQQSSDDDETVNFSSDNILGFGNNAKGQLGLGNDLVQSSLRGVHSVQYHHVNREVNLVATGGYFTILVTGTRNQQMFVCGENSYGQLFMNPETVTKLTTLTELDASLHPWLNRGVRAIGCGRTCTILVTMDHRIVSVGSNYDGQLGRTDCTAAFECSEPLGDGSLEFVKVACGMRHSLLLTSDGRVLCAGSKGYCSIVPVGKAVPGYDGWRFFQDFDLPRDASPAADGTTPHTILDRFFQRTGRSSRSPKNVTDIACGLYFSAFLVDNRQVYVCGFNRAGGPQNNTPTLLFDATTVGSQGIKCMTCAGRTLVVLTEEAEVYIHGEALAFNHEYQTMTHVSYSSLGIPPIDIRLIAGGEQHMIFVTSQNHVYVCGTNSFGQLGENVYTTQHLAIGPLRDLNQKLELHRREVFHVCCGAYFTLVVLKRPVKNERLWTYCLKQQLTEVEVFTQH